MNILIIGQFAGVPGLGGEMRPFQLAYHWKKAGWKPTILTPDYCPGRNKNIAIEGMTEQKNFHSVPYYFVHIPISGGLESHSLGHAKAFSQVVWKNADKIANELQPDFILLLDSDPFLILPVLKIVKRSGARLVYEAQQTADEVCGRYGYHDSHPVVLLTRFMERKAITSAQLVVSVRPEFEKYMKEKRLQPQRYVFIANGVEIMPPKPERMPTAHIEYINRLKEKNIFTVIYLDQLEREHPAKEFATAAGNVDGDTMFIIVGDGGYKIPLKRLIKDKHLSQVILLDGVEDEQVQFILSEADCLFCSMPGQIRSEGYVPKQLLQAMLAQKAIIFAGNNPVIEQANCGIIVEKKDPKGISAAVKKLKKEGSAACSRMGINGYDYLVKNHDIAVLAQEYYERFKQLL